MNIIYIFGILVSLAIFIYAIIKAALYSVNINIAVAMVISVVVSGAMYYYMTTNIDFKLSIIGLLLFESLVMDYVLSCAKVIIKK